jgi:hypothetical protein
MEHRSACAFRATQKRPVRRSSLGYVSRAISEFKKLSPARQAGIVAITAWNVALSVIAERDIQRRPSDEIRGSRAIWRMVCLTNTVGPLIYFRWGRQGR